MFRESTLSKELSPTVSTELKRLSDYVVRLDRELSETRRKLAESEAALARIQANLGKGEKAWLSANDVAVKLNVSTGWVAKRRRAGRIPRDAYQQLNARLFRYRRSYFESPQAYQDLGLA